MTIYIIVDRAEELFNAEVPIGAFAHVTSTSQWYKKNKTNRWVEIDSNEAFFPI